MSFFFYIFVVFTCKLPKSDSLLKAFLGNTELSFRNCGSVLGVGNCLLLLTSLLSAWWWWEKKIFLFLWAVDPREMSCQWQGNLSAKRKLQNKVSPEVIYYNGAWFIKINITLFAKMNHSWPNWNNSAIQANISSSWLLLIANAFKYLSSSTLHQFTLSEE